MRVVVCVKQVPDTAVERRLRAEDARVDRESVEGVVNELDEYAVEEGLRIVEAHGGEVTVVSMGPVGASEVVRKALAMGADAGVHLVDDGLVGSDAVGTSYALAQVVRSIGFDVVVVGAESTDARMGVMAAMLAERLGVPQLSLASRVEVAGEVVRVHRVGEDGVDVVEARWPVVVGVVEKINEPRYPSFKGIMAARKKPVTTVGMADVGIDPAVVGLAGAATQVVGFAQRPPRQAGTVVVDEGDGGVKLAEFLAAEKFI